MTAYDRDMSPPPRDGKWKVPTHLPKLHHDTIDYDWWFRQMREYLDDSRLIHESQWIDYYRIHCDRDFWDTVRDRLVEDDVDPGRVLSHPHKFQEYVCFRFTPPTYPNEVMGRLLALQEKSLDPTPAWLETSKLVFCYNEFMRRRKGTLITDLQHAYHFAFALKEPLFEYVHDLLEQRHSRVRTARRAYDAALRKERGRKQRRQRLGLEKEEEEGEDQVMTATAKRGRQEKDKTVAMGG